METAFQKSVACPVCLAPSAHQYDKDGFGVARCAACKTLFIENPPDDTSALYGESYFFGGEQGGYGSYDEEKEAMRQTFETCLDRIAAHTAAGTLFDVGAATGYFLALARARGYTVSGIDVSAAAAREAEKKGIVVMTGTLSSAALPAKSVDVVTMFDVLEHVARPGDLLRDAATLLKRGGIIMGSTPDSESAYARRMGRHWHLLCPPEHLVLMNDRSLRRLCAEHGLEVLWTGRITKRFSLPYICQTAARWLGIPLIGRIGVLMRGSWLGRLAIPLDLRDNIFFLARKKTGVAVY